MSDFRTRFGKTRGPHSAWAEWGPFVLAIIAAAGLLFMIARTSPIFEGPDPLPASESPHPSAAHANAQPDEAPPDLHE
jgi:hypothetical protein